MNSLLCMNVVETWFVAVWGLCWCNFEPLEMRPPGLWFAMSKGGFSEKVSFAVQSQRISQSQRLSCRLTVTIDLVGNGIPRDEEQVRVHLETGNTVYGFKEESLISAICR